MDSWLPWACWNFKVRQWEHESRWVQNFSHGEFLPHFSQLFISLIIDKICNGNKKNGFTSWEMSEFTRVYTWIIFCLLENVQGFIWRRNWCLCYIRLGCSSMSLVDNFDDVSSFMHISRHYKFSNLISFSPSKEPVKRVYWLFPKRCQNVIVNFWMKSDQSLIGSHQELRHKVFIYILSNTSQLNTRTHTRTERE